MVERGKLGHWHLAVLMLPTRVTAHWYEYGCVLCDFGYSFQNAVGFSISISLGGRLWLVDSSTAVGYAINTWLAACFVCFLPATGWKIKRNKSHAQLPKNRALGKCQKIAQWVTRRLAKGVSKTELYLFGSTWIEVKARLSCPFDLHAKLLVIMMARVVENLAAFA